MFTDDSLPSTSGSNEQEVITRNPHCIKRKNCAETRKYKSQEYYEPNFPQKCCPCFIFLIFLFMGMLITVAKYFFGESHKFPINYAINFENYFTGGEDKVYPNKFKIDIY